MARRYRRKNRESSSFQDATGFMALLVLGSTLVATSEFADRIKGALPILLPLALLLIVLIGIAAWKRYQRSKGIYKAYTIANIDTMSGIEFEVYLADLLRKRGFSNVVITEQYDLGVDIVAKKDGVTWGIQAKRYRNLVKAEAVRQVYAALVRYKCDKAMVVTNSVFSRPARELARDNGIELVDREKLMEWIYESTKVVEQ